MTVEIGGVVAGALMVVAHLVVQQATVAAAYGVLGPNAYIGIRNDATRSSREAWQAAHRAVLPIVGLGTLIGVGLSVIAIALADTEQTSSAVTVTLISAALLAVTVVIAERRARAVAERLLGDDDRRDDP